MATYSGIDKVGEFFAHYGRKGMKRGMNIYNPNYKPIGEKAKEKENKEMAEKAKKFNEYKKDGAKMVEQLGGDNVSERDYRTIVRSYQEVFSIINKALGLKVAEPDNFADDKTSSDYKKLKEALVENYARFIEYAKRNGVSEKEEAIESAMKNSSMEDATKVRSLIAKDREQSKIKRLGRLREKNRREALMEAERKRQAAIDRR